MNRTNLPRSVLEELFQWHLDEERALSPELIERTVQIITAIELDRIAETLETWPERIWQQIARLADAYEKQHPRITEAARSVLDANGFKVR